MGKVNIKYTKQFTDDLADLVFYIESKGMPLTAQKYVISVYDFIETLKFDKVQYGLCHDALRASEGLKCISYKGKYTIVFYQFSDEVIIIEFIPSKLII